MSISIEAIYESGVLKPLSPIPGLQEHEKVKLIVERESLIARQRRDRIQLPPEVVQALVEEPEFDLLES
jgi:predicted DNA-binding antitoxin AbrB/MazE fold protein